MGDKKKKSEVKVIISFMHKTWVDGEDVNYRNTGGADWGIQSEDRKFSWRVYFRHVEFEGPVE